MKINKLSNGLTYILNKNKHIESCTVFVMIKVGSIHEPKNIYGGAHLLEHMLFKGTKEYPSSKQISYILDSFGGIYNAYTSKNSTCYYIKLDKKHIKRAIKLLGSMIFHSLLDPQELKMEKKVVEAEIKKTRDEPSRYIFELNDTNVYNTHPLGRSIAAEIQEVHDIERDDLFTFYKTYYNPNNMVLSISGNYPIDIIHLIHHSIFSDKTTIKIPVYKNPILKQDYNYVVQCKKKDLREIHIMISFMACTIYDSEKYILDILNTIMASTMSSRLFRRLREKNGLVYGISMGLSLHEHYGNIYITAGVHEDKLYKNGKKMGAIKMLIDECIKLKYQSVSDKELQLAKDVLVGNISLRTEDSMDLAEYYGEQVLFNHPKIVSYKDVQKKYKKISKKDIMHMAQKYIDFNKMYINILGNIDNNVLQKYIKNNIFKKFIPKRIKKYSS